MHSIFRPTLFIVLFVIFCGLSVRTQTSDLQMIDIVPLNEPELNENLRYRAVCTNNGPDSLPDSTEVTLIWTVKNQSINTRYELAWQVNDTLRLLSPPYLFTRADSFEVCAEFDFQADSNTSNQKHCNTQVVKEPNSVPNRTGEVEFEIYRDITGFYIRGQVAQQPLWKLYDTGGRLVQSYKGDQFVPRVYQSGIFILQSIGDQYQLTEKVYLRGTP